MARRLARSVVVGGVVYPAGTAATPELDEQVPNPAHWADEADEADASDEAEESTPKQSAPAKRRKAAKKS